MEAVFAVVEVEIEREIDWTPRLKSRHASNDFRTWLTLAAAADKFVNWISTFTIFSTPLAGCFARIIHTRYLRRKTADFVSLVGVKTQQS